MGKIEKYEKLNKPGLWFVCSEHPASELKQYVYDFAVESGLPIVVYSDIPKKEIQNAVIDRIKTKCLENATDEKERDWLEQEMMEYNPAYFIIVVQVRLVSVYEVRNVTLSEILTNSSCDPLVSLLCSPL